MIIKTDYGEFVCSEDYTEYDCSSLIDCIGNSHCILDIYDGITALKFSYMNPSTNIYSFQKSVEEFNNLQSNIKKYGINNITVLYNNVDNGEISIDDLGLTHLDLINNITHESILECSSRTIKEHKPILVCTFKPQALEDYEIHEICGRWICKAMNQRLPFSPAKP